MGIGFHLVSLFPEMLKAYLEHGVVGQAVQKSLLDIHYVNPRDFAEDNHKTVDDRPYGGGDGMVMLAEPLAKSIESIREKNQEAHIVYLSPQGTGWSNERAKSWSKKTTVLICGRYGGIDQRFINKYVDEEVSMGDFILSGGELAALAVVDSVARYIPGVLGNEQSALSDSFSDGLLEGPLFTRPAEILSQKVPESLMSGDHKRIEKFRKALSLIWTSQRRPDLEVGENLLAEAKKTLAKVAVSDLESCGLSLQVIEEIHGKA